MMPRRVLRALFGVAGLVVGSGLVTRGASAQRSVTSWAIARLGSSAAESMAAKQPGDLVQALVELPPGADPVSLGLRPLLPGVAVLFGDSARIAGFVRAHPELLIEVAPPLRPKLDLAIPYIAADRVRLDGAGPGGVDLDGSGVYVGIVDTGLDVTHADFRGPDGKTRVAWLLDFSMKPRAGNARDEKYGARVFERAELQAFLDAKVSDGRPDDPDGHGTHVAGIAAGNGGLDKTYVGVAPRAELVIVRATRDESGSIDESDAIAGTAFVFDMAAADKVPAVVNLSLGSQFGPHDGTSTFERSLAQLAKGPGRAVVVAASNEGGTPIHTSLRVSPGAKFTIPIRMDGADGKGGAYHAAQVFLWLNLRDDGDVKIGISGPDGEKWLEGVAKGEGLEARPNGLLVQVINDSDDGKVIPRDTHGAIVTFRGALPVGDYKLVLEGNGAIEAWLQGVGEASDGVGAAYFPQGGQIEGTIGVPASSEALIAVGCVGVRRSYKKGPLKEFLTSAVPPGTRCYYSSAGPSANGAMRPDVLAPGYFVISALAHKANERIPLGEFTLDQVVDVTHEHAALSGTSMSTPFVTGAVAILLQKDPTLAQEDVRALLQAGARGLADDAVAPLLLRDYSKGAGILDVEGALTALARKGASSPAAKRMQLRLGASYLASDGGQAMHALVLSRDDIGRPADLSPEPQLTLDGATLRGTMEHPATGLYRFAILPRKGATQATIHLSSGSLSLSRDVPVAADRWDARFGLGAGGGCAFATPALGADGAACFPWPALGLATLALCFTRLRTRRARSRAGAWAGRPAAREMPDRLR